MCKDSVPQEENNQTPEPLSNPADSKESSSRPPEAPEPSPEPAPSAGCDAAQENTLTAALQADIEKFRDLAMRAQADFDNYRKRAAREREEAVKYANAALLEELLPILDNFDLGMSAASQDPAGAAILQGFAMVRKQFADFLQAQGVEAVEAAPGAEFDPKIHEALGQEHHDSIPDGAIIRQTRRGWKLKDRLLRPASVLVSRGPANPTAPPAE